MGKISVNLGDMLKLMRVDNEFIDVPVFKVLNCSCGCPAVFGRFCFRIGSSLSDIDYKVEFFCKDCFEKL